MATSINLAPGTQYLAEARQRRQRIFVISGLIAGGMLAVYLILVIYEGQITRTATATQGQIQQVDADIAKLDSDSQRIILFESRLADLSSLLNAHVNWGPLFTTIEQLLPTSTRVTGVDVNSSSGLIAISGETPDVDTIAASLASLSTSQGNAKTIFTSARLTDITRSEAQPINGQPGSSSYKFSADFTFDPKVIEGQ